MRRDVGQYEDNFNMELAFIVAVPVFLVAYVAAYIVWSHRILPFLRQHSITPSRFPHGGINFINQVIDGEKARELAKEQGRCPLSFRVHGYLLFVQCLAIASYPLYKLFEAMYLVFGD